MAHANPTDKRFVVWWLLKQYHAYLLVNLATKEIFQLN